MEFEHSLHWLMTKSSLSSLLFTPPIAGHHHIILIFGDKRRGQLHPSSSIAQIVLSTIPLNKYKESNGLQAVEQIVHILMLGGMAEYEILQH